MDEKGVPESAMVIVAHPDDAEFGMAGTVAAWTREGCRVAYVVCTDGNAGSHEPGMTREKLAELACYIELDKMGEPIGKQDQYAAALVGFNWIDFAAEGVQVERRPLPLESCQ